MNPKKSDLLIVGLGNPGLRYRSTRHNVGFLVVQQLARKKRFIFKRNRSLKSFVAHGELNGRNIWLAMPQTFMNLSGEAVKRIAWVARLAPCDILVVCDDVALPLGILRIKPRGSAGGHNGLASLIEKLGTQDFARLRVGIGRNASSKDLAQYVLSRFDRDEKLVLKNAVEKAVGAITAWVAEGIDQCMSSYNQKG